MSSEGREESRVALSSFINCIVLWRISKFFCFWIQKKIIEILKNKMIKNKKNEGKVDNFEEIIQKKSFD